MLDISEVSHRSGLPASTLRYYEEVGLISSAGRRGLRRIFEEAVLTRLSLISLGQAAGFSLTEIGQMLGATGTPSIDREQLVRKADDLDRKIRELTALRDGLRHTASCTAPSHLECPTFQRLMRDATTHVVKGRARRAEKKEKRP